MSNFTWKKFIAMKDQLIGKELQTCEDETDYRAKIKSVTVDEMGTININPEWVEFFRDGWQTSKSIFSVSANPQFVSNPSLYSSGISFRISGVGSVDIKLSDVEVERKAKS